MVGDTIWNSSPFLGLSLGGSGTKVVLARECNGKAWMYTLAGIVGRTMVCMKIMKSAGCSSHENAPSVTIARNAPTVYTGYLIT